MFWLENYYKNNLFYDLILRSPIDFKRNTVRSCMNSCSGKLEVSFSPSKIKENLILNLTSVFSEITLRNKVKIIKKRGFSGKNVYILSVKFQKISVINFLDFFLNLIIKGLKRRFIILKTSVSKTGVLNMRFSSFSELEIDDFFFFELDRWQGSLNIFLNFSLKPLISYFVSYYFLNVFNLKKLSKYEIFNGKG
jgi:hypothetical protein